MAKQRKMLPARRANGVDNSLLIRSAESLGRMIGSLQRQLDAARQLTVRSGATPRANGNAGTVRRTAGGTKRKVTAKSAGAKTSPAMKTATGGNSRRGAKRGTAKASRKT
jgi:hypothetical protein